MSLNEVIFSWKTDDITLAKDKKEFLWLTMWKGACLPKVEINKVANEFAAGMPGWYCSQIKDVND